MQCVFDMQTASIFKTSYNADVYEPSDDSFVLVDGLVAEVELWSTAQPAVVVEVGCGSGYVVCSAALMLKQLGLTSYVLATDVSSAALAATSATLAAHGMQPEVELAQDDLLTALHHRLRGHVDLLLFNPPYVVTPDEEVTTSGIAAAWAGGLDGRVVIDRFLAMLGSLLSEKGVAYMVAIQQNKPEQILQQVQERGVLSGHIVLTRRADEELISVLAFCRQSPK